MVNLPAIFIANVFGLLVLFIIMTNFKFRSGSAAETRLFYVMLITNVIACITDPICFYCDGKPGVLCFLGVYVGNLILFVANLVLGSGWLFFVVLHIKGSISPVLKYSTIGILTVAFALLIVNFFFPIVFEVSEDNVYTRGSCFFIYVLSQALFIMEGVIIYFIVHIRGGVLKFFPVWQFLIPVIVGASMQIIYYGISTIWPAVAISFVGMLFGMQNEDIYRDALTGLYNRYYLNRLQAKLKKAKSGSFTVFMMDLNGFKSINDVYGHFEGDDALRISAQIIKVEAGSIGSTIRYAGDEFVVIINSQDDNVIQSVVNNTRNVFKKFNKTEKKPYELSIAIGYTKLDLKETSVEVLMNEVDKAMYADKAEYYEKNPKLH